MNPSINSTDLETAVKTVSKGLSLTRSANTLNICYKDGAVLVRGCDNYLSTVLSFTLSTVPNGGFDPWEVNVNFRQFKDAVGCFPKEIPLSLSLETEGDRTFLTLTSVSGKNRVVACEPELQISPFIFEEASCYKPGDGMSWELPPELFTEMVKNAAFAASSDLCKQALAGVNFNFSSNGLEVSGCDGHRLSEFSLPIEGCGDEGSMVITAKPLREFASLLKKQNHNPVTIESHTQQSKKRYCSGKRLSLSFNYRGSKVLYSQGETSSYPHTKQLIPDRFNGSFLVGQKELLEELDQVSKVVKHGNNTVILDVKPEGVIRAIAHVKEADDATYEGDVRCAADTDGVRIGFNVRYLIDFLKLPVVKGQTVKFSHNSPTNPAVLTVEGCGNLHYLVMPVQIRS